MAGDDLFRAAPVDRPATIGDKVAHVVRAGQTRAHDCHWPGCGKQVPPAMWGCKAHWYRLPDAIRAAIWRAYRVGQEADGRPSAAYVTAARDAQDWIKVHAPPAPAGLL